MTDLNAEALEALVTRLVTYAAMSDAGANRYAKDLRDAASALRAFAAREAALVKLLELKRENARRRVADRPGDEYAQGRLDEINEIIVSLPREVRARAAADKARIEELEAERDRATVDASNHAARLDGARQQRDAAEAAAAADKARAERAEASLRQLFNAVGARHRDETGLIDAMRDTLALLAALSALPSEEKSQ